MTFIGWYPQNSTAEALGSSATAGSFGEALTKHQRSPSAWGCPVTDTEHQAELRRQAAQRGSRSSQKGIFARRGEYWTIGFAGSASSLKDIKGLSYIQRLLRHPGEDFHVLDLLHEPGRSAAESESQDASSLLSESSIRIGELGDAGEMLDAQAKQDYRRRLQELKEKLEDSIERGAREQAAQVESEIEFLQRELVRAVGLRGRDRRACSASERARLNVTRAIKAALQRISEHDTNLGELLARCIRTGSLCRYAADSRAPIDWDFLFVDAGPPAGNQPAPPLLTETNFPRGFSDQIKFVGRESERMTFSHCLDQAAHGQGNVIMIAGGPGVGKTRLACEGCAGASSKGFLVLVGNCYDRNDPIPFGPLVEMLEANASVLNKSALRDALGNDSSEIARLMPQLRRLFPDIAPSIEPSAEQSREILFTAISELLARAAADRPVLILLEDLHWADEGTLSLLGYIARRIVRLPVIIVGTHRDTELDAGGPLAKTLDELIRLRVIERVNLRGLPLNAVAEMIQTLSAREPPEALVSLIYSNTEGNPFFVEELFRHLFERGRLTDTDGEFRQDLHLIEVDIPQNLRLVIGRRLARLSRETRKMLDTAAIIGRSFTFELLEASSTVEADRLIDSVESAERAGLISSTLEYREAKFRFSHELIRQAVMVDISAPRRQRLHLQIAKGLESVCAGALEDHVNDLAYHLLQAGTAADPDKTVHYLALTTERAIQQSAYSAALQHSQSALELLTNLADTPERARGELDLQINRGVALVATKGWYARATGEAYGRARILCERLDEHSRLFSVLFGLWSFHLTRGEHLKAQVHADEMLRFALRRQSDGMLVQAYWSVGCSQFFMGEFIAARDNFRLAISGYDRRRHQTLAFQFAQDPYLSSLVFEAITLWTLGFPEQAEASAQAALAFARELGYPFSLAWCLEELTVYYSIRCDFISAARLIEEGLPLSKEHGYTHLEEGFLGCHMIALAAQGKMEELAANSLRARKFSDIEYEIRQTWVRSALAEAFGKAGKVSFALSLLMSSLEIMERNQEKFIEPELFRLRGELALRRGETGSPTIDHAKEAEQDFVKAIESARARSAKMLELRAAISLGRVLAMGGRADRAAQILKETCACFTEGFETPEFKTAQVLLDSLAPLTELVSS